MKTNPEMSSGQQPVALANESLASGTHMPCFQSLGPIASTNDAFTYVNEPVKGVMQMTSFQKVNPVTKVTSTISPAESVTTPQFSTGAIIERVGNAPDRAFWSLSLRAVGGEDAEPASACDAVGGEIGVVHREDGGDGFALGQVD